MTDTIERFQDPAAAAATYARVQEMTDKFAAMKLPVTALSELAVLFATSYTDEARAYHAQLLADGETEDLEYESLTALAWTALFGANGSDGQRAASATLRWSDEYRAAAH
jgi:hypothetical protein